MTGFHTFTMPYLVGLTGGIATGKSTVSKLLGDAGLTVVDADRIAREVVRRPLPAWRDIVDVFGEDVLDVDREIHRSRLADIIFDDPRKKDDLDRIVHPRVFETMAIEIDRLHRSSPGKRILLDVPLLIETGMHRDLPLILLVYAPEPVQIQRLMERDGMSKRAAMARVRAQMPIEAKRPFADIIIDNSGDREATRRQVLDICRQIQNGKLPQDRH